MLFKWLSDKRKERDAITLIGEGCYSRGKKRVEGRLVCMDYDRTLNRLLDWVEKGALKPKIKQRTVELGDLVIWTANWPYSYGYPYGAPTPAKKVFPHPITIIRLHRTLELLNDESWLSFLNQALDVAFNEIHDEYKKARES